MKLCAVLCYAIGLSGSAALPGLVLLHGLDAVPDHPVLGPPWSYLVDTGLLLLFGLQHSGMARESFKRRWTTVVPVPLERSLYVAASGLLSWLLALAWQPLGDGYLWRGPRALVVVPLAAGVGFVLVNLRFDHAGLFGLRQAWAGEGPQPPDRLLIVGPYRYVRHPLMACLLLFLWAQPVMSVTLVGLVGGLSVYTGVGVVLEERDLLRRFGLAYAAYRRRVPALVPWQPPAAPNIVSPDPQ
jgi:methanethiol S-methyltransferase